MGLSRMKWQTFLARRQVSLADYVKIRNITTLADLQANFENLGLTAVHSNEIPSDLFAKPVQTPAPDKKSSVKKKEDVSSTIIVSSKN